jgi:hypothetical protein
MANVEGGAGLNGGPARAKRGLQKLFKLRVGHPITFDREPVLSVTFVPDVIRRVREDEIRGFAGHQLCNRSLAVASPTSSL